MPNTLEEKDWDILLRRIRDGKCTPFLGAGASRPFLPLAYQIAQEWAKKYQYPFSDSDNLVRVAQFLAIDQDPMFPKEEILELFKAVKPPDLKANIHGVLANLPLPVYITTNYDDFMVRALNSRHRDPKRELCRWNKLIKDQPSIFDSYPGFVPTVANPVVFHLHGNNEAPESLVLTEDDLIDFLVNISRDQNLLPAQIRKALMDSTLLFIGYKLADLNFRVIFQGLVGYLEKSISKIHFSVQPMPGNGSEEKKAKAQKYLDQYFGKLDIRMYWGTADEFAAELKKRWEDYDR